MATPKDRLQPRWKELCSGLGVSEQDVQRWWDLLERRHGESQRAYHTLAHLDEMFGYFKEHQHSIEDAAAVSLAIFFHDVVYDPRQGTPQNEKDSADLFDQFVQEALPAGDPPGLAKGMLASKVRRWIVQTAHHKCTDSDELDCKLFMDFDMAVLGRPWPEYDLYSQQIRQEYIHVPEALFYSARSGFLDSVASGESDSRIFATPTFKDAREAQARANAAQEASMLRAKLAQCSLLARLGARAALRMKALAASSGLRRLAGGVLGGTTLAGAVAAPKVMLLALGLPLTVAGAVAALPLLGSDYVRQPLPAAPAQSRGLAIVAGSYNPPHQGHLEVVRFLSRAHERVHVVIGVNPSKTYAVSPYTRQELLRAMLRELQLDNVEVVVYHSYIWKHAHAAGASVMYRGIRTWRQDGPDEKLLEFQNIYAQFFLGGGQVVPTAYIQADPKYTGVSSTLLRKRLKDGESITDLVPPGCAAAVQQAYADKTA